MLTIFDKYGFLTTLQLRQFVHFLFIILTIFFLPFWQSWGLLTFENLNSDNLCHLTIKSDTGNSCCVLIWRGTTLANSIGKHWMSTIYIWIQIPIWPHQMKSLPLLSSLACRLLSWLGTTCHHTAPNAHTPKKKPTNQLQLYLKWNIWNPNFIRAKSIASRYRVYIIHMQKTKSHMGQFETFKTKKLPHFQKPQDVGFLMVYPV